MSDRKSVENRQENIAGTVRTENGDNEEKHRIQDMDIASKAIDSALENIEVDIAGFKMECPEEKYMAPGAASINLRVCTENDMEKGVTGSRASLFHCHSSCWNAVEL